MWNIVVDDTLFGAVCWREVFRPHLCVAPTRRGERDNALRARLWPDKQAKAALTVLEDQQRALGVDLSLSLNQTCRLLTRLEPTQPQLMPLALADQSASRARLSDRTARHRSTYNGSG